MQDLRFRRFVVLMLVLQSMLLVLLVWFARHDHAQQAERIAAKLLHAWSASPVTAPDHRNGSSLPVALLQQTLRDGLHDTLRETLNETVRETVRAELASTRTDTRAIRGTASAPDRSLSAATAEQQQLAFVEADAVVSAALASGRWTEHDSRTLLPHLPDLSLAQRTSLLDKFYGAVNRQELKLEDLPPL